MCFYIKLWFSITSIILTNGAFSPDNNIRIWGHNATLRPHLDNETNRIYLIEPHNAISENGHIVRFKFYAKRVGQTYIQIYRRVRGMLYKSVSTTDANTRTGYTGVVTKEVEPINVQKGDLVGLYAPQRPTIPYDGHECWSRRGFYADLQRGSGDKAGISRTFSVLLSGSKPCRTYSLSLEIKTGWIHGYKPISRPMIDAWTHAMFIPDPARKIDISGNITGWEFYANRTGFIYLQVFRRIGSFGRYTKFRLIGQTVYPISKAPGLQQVNLSGSYQIRVQKGDVIGFYFSGRSVIPFDGKDCSTSQSGHRTMYIRRPRISIGRLYTMRAKLNRWKACRTYSLRALIKST